MAFKIVGSAFHDAVKKAQPTMTEPIMKMEITVLKNIWGLSSEICLPRESDIRQ